jgi:hypothetical protein
MFATNRFVADMFLANMFCSGAFVAQSCGVEVWWIGKGCSALCEHHHGYAKHYQSQTLVIFSASTVYATPFHHTNSVTG